MTKRYGVLPQDWKTIREIDKTRRRTEPQNFKKKHLGGFPFSARINHHHKRPPPTMPKLTFANEEDHNE